MQGFVLNVYFIFKSNGIWCWWRGKVVWKRLSCKLWALDSRLLSFITILVLTPSGLQVGSNWDMLGWEGLGLNIKELRLGSWGVGVRV